MFIKFSEMLFISPSCDTITDPFFWNRSHPLQIVAFLWDVSGAVDTNFEAIQALQVVIKADIISPGYNLPFEFNPLVQWCSGIDSQL